MIENYDPEKHTRKQFCVSAALDAGYSQKEAEKACADCSDEPLLGADAKTPCVNGIAVKAPKSGVAVKTTSAPDTVRFVEKGPAAEKMFIEDQLKHGDSKEHAEKLAKGILVFIEDKKVADSTESTIYYTHNKTGEREFFAPEPDKPKGPSLMEHPHMRPEEIARLNLILEVAAMREEFGDSKEDAFERACQIFSDAFSRWEPITAKTLKLREVFVNKDDYFKQREAMACWQLERQGIEDAALEKTRLANRSGERLTVPDSYGKTKQQLISEADMLNPDGSISKDNTFKDFNREHDVHREIQVLPQKPRSTVPDLYGKTRKQILKELQEKEP